MLRGTYMIDGTGAPTQGPVDIVVENDRIVQVQVVGFPHLAIDPEDRPLNGGRELDVAGMYLLPGFIDTHLHLHSRRSGQNVPAEYVLKLWLAHGVTSGRTVGGDHGTPWEIDIAKKLAANTITGPQLAVYPSFDAEEAGSIETPAEARPAVEAGREARQRQVERGYADPARARLRHLADLHDLSHQSRFYAHEPRHVA